MTNNPENLHLGSTARLVKVFLLSKLPTSIILVSLLAGLAALLYTPREEDPQIKVPMVDILVIRIGLKIVLQPPAATATR